MSTKTTDEKRLMAIAKHLDASDDITDAGDGIFEYGREEYLVLTGGEAYDRIHDAIEESLWAFNAEFIAAHANARLHDKAIDALRKMQVELCEDANELVRALIGDFDHFVRDAISADGRGHFLASYDGKESEVTVDGQTFYIYRVN